MPYQIVQVDDETGKLTKSDMSFPTLKEAIDQLEKDDAEWLGDHGYDVIGGFWWRKDAHGRSTRHYADDIAIGGQSPQEDFI